MDQLAERLGIDLDSPTARLAQELAAGDLEMTLALVSLRKAVFSWSPPWDNL